MSESKARLSDRDLQTLRNLGHGDAADEIEGLRAELQQQALKHLTSDGEWMDQVGKLSEELEETRHKAMAFEQAIESLAIPWLDVSSATDHMTPEERIVAAVAAMKAAAIDARGGKKE